MKKKTKFEMWNKKKREIPEKYFEGCTRAADENASVPVLIACMVII